MIAFLLFCIALAVAIALAPIILGVIGTMLGLIATLILWLFAGMPDNKPSEPTPAEKARIEAPFQQFEQWEREDAARNEAARQKRLKVGPLRPHSGAGIPKIGIGGRVLDAQKRVHAASDEIDHAQP